MCIVSDIHDYGKTIPIDRWTIPGIEQFKTVIEEAEKFDAANGEPDCVDPEKVKLIDQLAAIKLRLEIIELGQQPSRWMIDNNDKCVVRETLEPFGKVICSTEGIAYIVVDKLNDY